MQGARDCQIFHGRGPDSGQQHRFASPVEWHERADRASLDGLNHALQRLIGFFARRCAATAPG
jgi:hypothetical protein